MKFEGKTWYYGDNIDTDVIIPARYLNSFDPAELATHCMVDIDESFAKNVKKGDIMVGGWNFGCGSSREHAPIAIKASGIPSSSRQALPASSTATPSTSACRSSKSATTSRRFTQATAFL